MKKLSLPLLSSTVTTRRKAMKITQANLAKMIGMNRSVLSKLESGEYSPSVDQLQALSEVLQFNPMELFVTPAEEQEKPERVYDIAVAGTGYVGLSLAVLLAQHNNVTAVDILEEKVEKLNNYISPIQDEYIEKFLKEAKDGKRELHLKATTDGEAAYRDPISSNHFVLWRFPFGFCYKAFFGNWIITNTDQHNRYFCIVQADKCPHILFLFFSQCSTQWD